MADKQAGGAVPLTREEIEKRLFDRLTPEGKRFSERLDKSLDDEFALLSCDAADRIRAHLDEHHLKNIESVKAVNSLAAHHARPRVTAYYLIMNHANLLLISGELHRAKGILTEKGEQALQVWEIYAHRLVDLGMETFDQIEASRRKMMESIAEAGKGSSLTLLGKLTSMFRKEEK